MAFGDDIEKILPSYLVQSENEKTRLKDALSQFTVENRGKEIDYTDFYKSYRHLYFMQSDLLREIRMPYWDDENDTFNKAYPDALILTNSCDISFDNKHDLNKKQCLLAPIVDFEEYVNDLKAEGYSDLRLEQFINSVKAQLVSNLFYLPFFFKEKKEYIVQLDNVFWFPSSELNSYVEEIEQNRITSLSLFGYYLFILKLSYHLCRLPEQCDREFNL